MEGQGGGEAQGVADKKMNKFYPIFTADLDSFKVMAPLNVPHFQISKFNSKFPNSLEQSYPRIYGRFRLHQSYGSVECAHFQIPIIGPARAPTSVDTDTVVTRDANEEPILLSRVTFVQALKKFTAWLGIGM
jgi:hypothetical protein